MRGSDTWGSLLDILGCHKTTCVPPLTLVSLQAAKPPTHPIPMPQFPHLLNMANRTHHCREGTVAHLRCT